MKISIVTPTYNSLTYLKRNIRSINDQKTNAKIEHIVIDGSSKDGTPEFLMGINKSKLKWISETDRGMYHALNKGLNLATGDIIGHLNSDEQYLPGALEKVVQIFEENPKIDIIYGHCIFVNPDGTPVCFRKSYTPKWYLIRASYLYLMTCTIFFRRKIVDLGFRYEENLKSIGDEEFFCSILQSGIKGKVVNHYFSTFTMTGSNLMLKPVSFDEVNGRKLPWWITYFKPFINAIRILIRLIEGGYREKLPMEYKIFTEGSLERKPFIITEQRYTYI